MRHRYAAALWIVALAGSANGADAPTNPWLAFKADPANAALVREIGKMQWYDACIAWGREARALKVSRREDALLAYLVSERMVNGKDRGNVLHKTVDVGMTECGVLASLGRPEAANNTHTARGRTTQYVYRSSRMYIYTAPSLEYSVGVVLTIQD
jgi:hypothetical protein